MLKNLRKTRGGARAAWLEVFEPRVLLSGTYIPSDLAATWTLGGLTKGGSMAFDGVSAVTAGTWTNQDATVPSVLVGTTSTYTVALGGAVGIGVDWALPGATVSTSLTASGIFSATKDLVALNETVAGSPTVGGLDVLINHVGTFAIGDLAGTWNIASANFRGTVTLNVLGQVTGGLIYLQSNQKSSPITAGTATLNANGTGTLALNTKFKDADSAFATMAFNVTMNAAKDVAMAVNANLAQPQLPSGTGPAELTMLVKSAGKYTRADVAGLTWTIASALGAGTITFGNGGGLSGSLQDTAGITWILSGNYTLGSSGTMVTNLTATHGGSTNHFSLLGAMNGAKNLFALDKAVANNGTNSSLTLLISPANHAPTELAQATWPQPAHHASALTINYAGLLAATGAHDLDNDPLSFLITVASTASGTMTITHGNLTTSVTPGVTLMVPGDTLTWTPSAAATGLVDAFSVRATDGADPAANDTRISISTWPIAAVSAKSVGGSVLETKAGTHAGDGKILLQRVGGDQTQSLTVTLAITGTAQQGVHYNLIAPDGVTVLASAAPTVVIPAGKNSVLLTLVPLDDQLVDPTLTIIVTVADDPDALSPAYAPSDHPSAQVNVLDGSPQVTITPRSPAINEGAANVSAFIVTRLPAQGGNVNGPLTVNLAYSGTFDTADDLSAPASVTFLPGEVKKTIKLSTTDNHIANDTQTLIATVSGTGFFAAGDGSATVNVLDASPIVTVAALHATASEAHPGASPGKFQIRRTGSTAAPLTVDFTTATGGTFGTLGTNYTLTDAGGNPLTTSVILPQGKSSITITLTPIDDTANDPTLHATVVLQQDAGPTYHIGTGATGQVTVNIMNLDRRPTTAQASVIQTTPINSALTLTYAQLVTLMGAALAPGETNGTLQLKVTAENAGTLQIMPGGGSAVLAAVGTIIDVGDSIVWTPPANTNAILAAFTLRTIDGTLASAVSTKFSIWVGMIAIP